MKMEATIQGLGFRVWHFGVRSQDWGYNRQDLVVTVITYIYTSLHNMGVPQHYPY